MRTFSFNRGKDGWYKLFIDNKHFASGLGFWNFLSGLRLALKWTYYGAYGYDKFKIKKVKSE